MNQRTVGSALLATCFFTLTCLFTEPAAAEEKNTAPRLPRNPGYQADLVRWLASIRGQDVAFKAAPLRYDGSFTDTTDLANLWVELYGGRSYLNPNGEAGCKLLTADAKWFVLDDQAGAGIEGSGTVRMFPGGVLAAYWYQRAIPLAGKAEGNPCCRNPALARRVLVTAAVDMLMQDRDHTAHNANARSDFLGGQLNAWAYAYLHCKGAIDPQARAAFEAGISHMLDKILKWGPRDVNTNMDIRAISAAAYVYLGTTDPQLKGKAVRVARRFLFGQEDGSLATLDSRFRQGLFHAAGYIAENQGPETTYNGVSLFHLLEAHAITRGDHSWKFLEEVVRRMLDFKLYQYFPDPDGRFDGPSGYANRTGNSYVFDQRDRSWRDYTAAGDFAEGRPLARSLKYGSKREGGRSRLPAPERMASDLRESVQVFNQQGFAQASTAMPPPWKHEHWPPDCPYSAAPGWYEKLRKLEQAEDPSLLTPFERPGPIQRAFGTEFWLVKNNDGQRDFGFFLETISQSCYAPWLGGSLQAFWTRPAGILLLACHDKTGDEADKMENTRVWPQIDTWATHHVWGSDAQGAPLSTAADITDNKVRHELDLKTAQVEVTSSLVRGPGGGGQRGTDGEVVASTSVTTRFEALSDGIRITHKVVLGPSDRLAQLWCTLPVFLRNAEQSKLADTTIEYWDGSAWQPLKTDLVATRKVRLGRDFGGGRQFGYIHFDEPRRVKLSGSVWQASYQSRNRLRNLHIDLHGQTGTVKTLAGAAISLTVTTADQ